MNFSGVPKSSLVGRLARWPLQWIPGSARMPILQGPLRGWWWVVGAGSHGYWLGSYEQAKSGLFVRGIRPGEVVYDVGANAGYYTLLAASATGREGRVVSFEPLPANLKFLRQHIALNGLKQVEVFEAAVSDHAGETFFEVAASRSMGRISERGNLPVRLVALDELVESGKIPAAQLFEDRRGRRGNAGARRGKERAGAFPARHLPGDPRAVVARRLLPRPRRSGLPAPVHGWAAHRRRGRDLRHPALTPCRSAAS